MCRSISSVCCIMQQVSAFNVDFFSLREMAKLTYVSKVTKISFFVCEKYAANCRTPRNTFSSSMNHTHFPMSQQKYPHASFKRSNKWMPLQKMKLLYKLLHFTWKIARNHLFCLFFGIHSVSMEMFLISSVHLKSISHNFAFLCDAFVCHLNATMPSRHDSLECDRYALCMRTFTEIIYIYRCSISYARLNVNVFKKLND